MKAVELQQWIEKELPNPVPEDAVDGIFAGDPQTEVHGIAITFLPSIYVLQEAARRGLNFIIGHEPIFYHHPWLYPKGDEYKIAASPEDLEEKRNSPPGREKQKLVAEHDLVFYRLHDAWNDFPDRGMGLPLEALLGWQGMRITQDAWIYKVAPIPLEALAAFVGKKLGKLGIRYVGNPDRVIKRVSLDWGSPGAIEILKRGLIYETDAAITGEVIEWRDIEYARDVDIALILGGHHATETEGMRAFCKWLVKRQPDFRVEYIDAGDPDRFVTF